MPNFRVIPPDGPVPLPGGAEPAADREDRNDVDGRLNFFISHASADRAWAEWVCWHLEAAGYTAELDVNNWAPGESFVANMDRALARADRVVALLSRSYFDSRWAREEYHAALARERSPQHPILLPVRIDDCTLPPLLKTRIYVDLTNPGRLDEKAASVRLLDGVRQALGRSTRPEASPGPSGWLRPVYPSDSAPISNLPPKTAIFVGREKELGTIGSALGSDPRVVVHTVAGPGGSGATQLAIAYALRHQADYTLTWFIHAGRRELLVDGFAALAPALSLGVGLLADDAVAAVRDALSHRDRWLLIIDGFPDADDTGTVDLWKYLPSGVVPAGRRHILITTRHVPSGGADTVTRIGPLTLQDSLTLLCRALPPGLAGEVEDATRLVEYAGRRPLALRVIIAGMAATGEDAATYLSRLHARPQDLLGRRPSDSHQTVGEVIAEALDRLDRRAPGVGELLRAFSFLAPTRLPLSVVVDAQHRLDRGLAGAVVDPRDIVAQLRRSGLANGRVDGSIEVDAMVAAAVRASLADRVEQSRSSEQQRRDRTAAVRRAAVILFEQASRRGADLSNRSEGWQLWYTLMPHVLAFLDRREATQANPAMVAELADRAATYLLLTGQAADALQWFKRAYAIELTRHRRRPEAEARRLRHYAGALLETGRPQGALEIIKMALEKDEEAYGHNRPVVATDLCVLGNIQLELGQTSQASKAFGQALAIRSSIYPAGAPELAVPLTGLGRVALATGRPGEAGELLKRAVVASQVAATGASRQERVDPAIVPRLAALARAVAEQGDAEASQVYLGQALVLAEQVYGADHPRTAEIRAEYHRL